MKIFIVRATAKHEEFSGTSNFIHKRAFMDKEKAEAFLPIFETEIANDKTNIATYCKVKGKSVV